MSKVKFLVGISLSSLVILGFVFLSLNQKKQKVSSPPKYVGAILPHDILAKNLIDDFLFRLNYSPQKIYIIGPNHFEAGNSVVITNKNSETNNLLKLNNKKTTLYKNSKVKDVKYENKTNNDFEYIITVTFEDGSSQVFKNCLPSSLYLRANPLR